MSAHFDYDVFISHSSKDKPMVRESANRLKQDGLRVWLDEWDGLFAAAWKEYEADCLRGRAVHGAKCGEDEGEGGEGVRHKTAMASAKLMEWFSL